ncbi:hypothetical protein BDZ94DRAFT_1256800 [Collybia nuda]|uniref:Uncharacterized protein n=1 Tax=Collybia nuda TaxID=64659 RepID=A0A9P5YAT4_9AGAR|nr:hypothetical protein BDZ94DRAFT_1256800 [Collybia nuda]
MGMDDTRPWWSLNHSSMVGQGAAVFAVILVLVVAHRELTSRGWLATLVMKAGSWSFIIPPSNSGGSLAVLRQIQSTTRPPVGTPAVPSTDRR